MTEVVDQASDKQQRTAGFEANQARIVTGEQENRDAGAHINGNPAQQRRRLSVPAILTGECDHPVAASPARNKRSQRGRDAERDSKAERKLEQVT